MAEIAHANGETQDWNNVAVTGRQNGWMELLVPNPYATRFTTSTIRRLGDPSTRTTRKKAVHGLGPCLRQVSEPDTTHIASLLDDSRQAILVFILFIFF